MPVINGVYLKDFTALPGAVADANIIPIAVAGNQISYKTTVAGIVTDARVTSKLLTGLSVTGGAVVSTDTILQAFGKVQNQINSKVSSVGLSMPAAFIVTNSPINSSGTITVTGSGLASQYIRGDGQLADFPTGGGGGGSSVSYYLNGSVNQGTFVGNTYYEMNKTPVLGAGTDFTINANGYIAQFITDANDPNSLLIPAGNWNFETYLSASSGGGSPTFYVELYKYNGTAFTLIASNSATPELIAFGTNIAPYFSSLAVPETVLLATDRLAIRIYVTHSGRTITLHTEGAHLCQIVTTFTTGLQSLNALSKQVQYFAVGTSGTDFNISSSVDTHTFNIPNADSSARGLVSIGTQSFAGVKTFLNDAVINGVNIGKGGGGVASNTMVGLNALFGNTSGLNNTATGNLALAANTTGDGNSAFGNSSLAANTTGSNNVAFGTYAGRYFGTSTSLTLANNSVFLGYNTRANANNETNQIVIGYDVLGNGSNTVTIGNSSITNNYFTGNIRGGAFIPSGATIPTNGMYLSAANTLDFATNSVNRLSIPSSGNVLIGTTTDAGYKLDVNGTARIASNLTVDTDTLFVDATNNRVGVGTVTPTGKIHISTPGGPNSGLVTTATSSTSYASTDWINSSGDITQMLATGSGYSFGTILSRQANFNTNAPNGLSFIAYNATGFITWGAGGLNERMRLHASGNFSLGPTTDAGYKLDVNGTARIASNLTVDTNTLFVDATNNRVGIGTTSPTEQLEIVQIQSYYGDLNGLLIRDSSNIQANFSLKGGTGATDPSLKVASLSPSLGGIGGSALFANYYDLSSFYPIRFLGSVVDFETTASSYSARITAMRIFSSSNVGIGTTTDAGYKLDVNGTGRFSGAVTATSVNVVYNNALTGQTADDVTLATYTAGASNELLQITITLTNNNATGQVRATFTYTDDNNQSVTLGAIATTPNAAYGEGQAVIALNIKNGTTLTIKSLITVGGINYNSRIAITKIL